MLDSLINKDFPAIRKNLRLNLLDFLRARRLTYPPELARAEKISTAIEDIKARWPNLSETINDSERPVFIFSAGWRSGSTLLQRLVCSSREVLIWGEPLGDAAFIARLAHCLGFITKDWPPETFFAYEITDNIENKWIANLTPEISYLKEAHREFFLRWCKSPTQEQFNISRWGIKEVRLTIDHARYLKWLFPNARFLFIYRNPCHAFRSWKGNKWRSPWPGYYSRSAIAFAKHWRLLLDGFLSNYAEVDGLLVRFEDLVSGKLKLDEIATHINVKGFDNSVLNRKINSPGKTVKKPEITLMDRIIINKVCGPLMRQVGYI